MQWKLYHLYPLQIALKVIKMWMGENEGKGINFRVCLADN